MQTEEIEHVVEWLKINPAIVNDPNKTAAFSSLKELLNFKGFK